MEKIKLAYQLAEALLKTEELAGTSHELGFPDIDAIVLSASEMIVAFDPKLVDEFGSDVILEEWSLTYPKKIKIKRKSDIRFRFTLPNGEVMTKEFSGLTARLIQTRIDLLNGIDYRKYATLYHRNKAK